MAGLRVLIVDDTIVYRRILTEAVTPLQGVGLVDAAPSAEAALAKMDSQEYDVVLLDNIMPGMGGLDLLKIIKARHVSPAVIMVSGSSGENGEITLQALEHGALDFIIKPTAAQPEKNLAILQTQLGNLLSQIELGQIKSPEWAKPSRKAAPPPLVEEPKLALPKLARIELVVIAASTGGPVAIKRLLQSVSQQFSVPVLILQHMPSGFTAQMAASLTKDTVHPVKEAGDREQLRAGSVYLAAGGKHLKVRQNGNHKIFAIDDGPLVNGVKPAADVLLGSLAEEFLGAGILAVVLTGMGSDGVAGVRAIKARCSVYAIAQSEASCVVYGMPKALVEAGLADEVRDLDAIGSRMTELLGLKGGR